MQRMFVLFGFVALIIVGCDGDRVSPVEPGQKQATQATMPEDIRRTLEAHEADGADVDLSVLRMEGFGDPTSSLWDNYDVYALTVLWGEYPGIPGPTVPGTDWSGTLSVENGNGLIDVAAEIDFEHGQDSVIPHNSAHFAAWVSVTNGDIDGLSFLVFLDRTNDAAITPQVHFSTPLFDLVLDRSQLAHHAAFYVVGNTHAVAVLSRQIWQNTCPGGFLKGNWVQYSNVGDTGYFQALWLDRAGAPVGLMTAVYWTNDDGTRLYQGTISGVITDVVLGEVNGVWCYDDPRMCPLCGIGHGWFRGRFLLYEMGDDPEREGSMGGVFGDYALPIESRVLPLQGIWTVDCPNVTTVVAPIRD